MLTNAFAGRKAEPAEKDLLSALGPNAASRWQKLLSELLALAPDMTSEWHSYSPKAGWSLRLKSGKRTIIHLVPGPKSFEAAFALGDKALAAVRASPPSQNLLTIAANAPRYGEGTAIRIGVANTSDIQDVLTVARSKLANWALRRNSPKAAKH
jgi:hypothetical protein